MTEKKPYKYKAGDEVYWWDKTDKYIVESINDTGTRENRYWIYLADRPDVRMDVEEHVIRNWSEFVAYLDDLIKESKVRCQREVTDLERRKKTVLENNIPMFKISEENNIERWNRYYD